LYPAVILPTLPACFLPSLPDTYTQTQAAFQSAFQAARTPAFDAAFDAVTPDGASCGQQLCWCLLDLPPGVVLPLHAHKNLEVGDLI
jgi:hypothetical protein